MPTIGYNNALGLRPKVESNELAASFMKLLPINVARVVATADFIPTKPPSTRIFLRMILGRRAGPPTRAVVAEFLHLETMCDSCTAGGGVVSVPDQWVASVQLRHRVPNRSMLSYLESLFSTDDSAVRAIQINHVDQGIDFFFGQQSHAVELLEMISKFAPVKTHTATHTSHKYTFSVEIPPFYIHDLICLPPNVVVGGNPPGPIVFCTGMSNGRIALLDPLTLRQCYLDADQYWGAPFMPLLSRSQLVEYMVFDVEIIDRQDSNWCVLAEVRVARLSDLGTVFSVKTHLGRDLKPGDHALGYDLYGVKVDDFELAKKHEGLVLPEAILIRRSYEQIRRRMLGV